MSTIISEISQKQEIISLFKNATYYRFQISASEPFHSSALQASRFVQISIVLAHAVRHPLVLHHLHAWFQIYDSARAHAKAVQYSRNQFGSLH